MIGPHTAWHLSSFYGPWLLALAASSAGESGRLPRDLVVNIHGVDVPIVQLALAAAGVLMARPLAPRREQERGLLRQVLVTVIMMIVAASWALESRPGILFTFVVSIGLGFSGYALIELAGREIETVIKRIFAHVADTITSIGGGPGDKPK